MNSVQLTGNLTRDPELRYANNENRTAICRFTIAVNEGYGDKQRTDFPNIVTFSKQAENCSKYLVKGSKVAITGRLQTGSYTKDDGTKVYTTDVVASKVEFLGSKAARSSAASHEAPEAEQAPPEDFGVPEGFQSIEDEDIPF